MACQPVIQDNCRKHANSNEGVAQKEERNYRVVVWLEKNSSCILPLESSKDKQSETSFKRPVGFSGGRVTTAHAMVHARNKIHRQLRLAAYHTAEVTSHYSERHYIC